MKGWLIIFAAVGTVMLQGCYYDKFEDFRPKLTCDTAAASYVKDLKPVADANCISCHTAGNESGGVKLDTYEGVKAAASSGKLYSAVSWDGKASPMPKGATEKLSDCTLSRIKKWIDSNYPQ